METVTYFGRECPRHPPPYRGRRAPLGRYAQAALFLSGAMAECDTGDRVLFALLAKAHALTCAELESRKSGEQAETLALPWESEPSGRLL